MLQRYKLRLNGLDREVESEPERSLLIVLRNELDLTGTKYGCGEGQCGACTVLVDGQPQRSCGLTVADVAGRSVTTIEGLAPAGQLHPVQQAFLELDSFQCGYCSPGMILTAAALLERDAAPTRETIIKAMNGNLCRCGTYPRIIAAIQRAAAIRQGAER